MAWRWDQGRLKYFEFSTLKKIAKALIRIEGVNPQEQPDPLRTPLSDATGQPFSPADYSVWRNYSRVFKCSLLAAKVDGRLTCTDICRDLASDADDSLSADDFLSVIIKKTYFPSPVFQGYDSEAQRVFPFIAIVKLLYANHLDGGVGITITDIIEKIIGNDLDGREPLDTYKTLRANDPNLPDNQIRQIRELVIFISQASFLKWKNPTLTLDITDFDQGVQSFIDYISTPIEETRLPDPDVEILNMGTIDGIDMERSAPSETAQSIDLNFTEGKKVRASHLRYERSPKLRKIYFENTSSPHLCDMCGMNTASVYPWTDGILELHHLLPLSSPVQVGTRETSIDDIVALCPTCHRSVHTYYRQWLKQEDKNDFSSKEEAIQVYNEAKDSFGA